MKTILQYITCVLLLAIMLSFTSCAQDYADDIMRADKEVADLKAEDIRLRKELSDSIVNFRAEILKRFTDTEGRLNTDIAKEMEQLSQRIQAQTTRHRNFVDSTMKARMNECDEKIKHNRKLLIEIQSKQADLLGLLEARVQKAMNEGDNKTAEQLIIVKAKINAANDYAKKNTDQIAEWKQRLETLHKVDFTNEFKQIDIQIKQLREYNLKQLIADMQVAMDTYAEEKFNELTNEEMTEINTIYQKFLDAQLKSYMEDVFTWSNEMEEGVANAQIVHDEVLTSLENLNDDITTHLEELLSFYEEGSSTLENALSELETACEEMISHATECIENGGQMMSDAFTELYSLNEEAHTNLDYWKEEYNSIAHGLGDLRDAIEEWKDNHPWYFE